MFGPYVSGSVEVGQALDMISLNISHAILHVLSIGLGDF